jgi:broad specificity phosphatase PhoE
MIRFLLLRHAESKWVEYARTLPRGQERFGGRMNDVELSGLGWRQAALGGGYMRRQRIRPTHYISSPATRAKQTHEGVQGGMGIKPPTRLTIIDELQEMTWGDWEGQLRSVAREPMWAAERARLGYDFCPPNGESYNMVRARVLPALRGVARQVPDGSLVCVHTHQNVIKSLVYPWMRWTHDQAMAASLGVVSLTAIDFEQGDFTLGFYNRQTLPTEQ